MHRKDMHFNTNYTMLKHKKTYEHISFTYNGDFEYLLS